MISRYSFNPLLKYSKKFSSNTLKCFRDYPWVLHFEVTLMHHLSLMMRSHLCLHVNFSSIKTAVLTFFYCVLVSYSDINLVPTVVEEANLWYIVLPIKLWTKATMVPFYSQFLLSFIQNQVRSLTYSALHFLLHFWRIFLQIRFLSIQSFHLPW